jgi:dTDP-glucose pyrophosphorylase
MNKMKNKTLLIMAAGMGSRYGGLKQIEPVGPNGEFIIDYSIYDAIKCGFTKVVFIIKKENYEIFKETIGNRVESRIPVEYVFQKIDNLPDGYSVPDGRTKPWGTAHAILSAKDVIQEPFLIINADDFYGRDAYKVASNFMDLNHNSNKKEFSLVGYKVINTLTENGSVKRGVCIVKDNHLIELKESIIEQKGNIIEAVTLCGNEKFTIGEDTLVSMNMMSFTPSIFEYIESNFVNFLKENTDNIDKCEYLIPDILAMGVKEGYCNVTVLDTTSKWVGVTYKEDIEEVIKYISDLVKSGEYNKKLW